MRNHIAYGFDESLTKVSSGQSPLCLPLSVYAMKQIYKITYPTGKIYIGKDAIGSQRYFGSPDMEIINADFQSLPEELRKDYTIRKQILWESETATDAELAVKEVEFIRQYQSHNPDVGYNRWPKFK